MKANKRYCVRFCLVKQRTVCIINVWGYKETLPKSEIFASFQFVPDRVKTRKYNHYIFNQTSPLQRLCSKWRAYNTDAFVASQLGRCIRTNRQQCALLTKYKQGSAFRVSGILQLPKTGPPLTKNFPVLRMFPSDAMMA